MTNEERVEAILSSASLPFMLPPVELDAKVLADGGVFTDLDLGDPIQRCREEEGSDVDIIVDLVLCYGEYKHIPRLEPEDARWMNAYQFYNRR